MVECLKSTSCVLRLISFSDILRVLSFPTVEHCEITLEAMGTILFFCPLSRRNSNRFIKQNKMVNYFSTIEQRFEVLLRSQREGGERGETVISRFFPFFFLFSPFFSLQFFSQLRYYSASCFHGRPGDLVFFVEVIHCLLSIRPLVLFLFAFFYLSFFCFAFF